jgi:DNA excision repair protein ERCC-6
MGLGKTIQVISFLAGLGLSMKLKGPVLIVCPATVLRQWVQEFHKWWPPFRVCILHSTGSGVSGYSGMQSDGFSDSSLDSETEEEDTPQKRKQSKAPAYNASSVPIINKVLKDGHVLITTYAGIRVYQKHLLPIKWGYVVLDEGHKIRNPDADITIKCKQLKVNLFILLTYHSM